MLATQNPVDLDYKGLGNAGTWFIGRLQTDRDKARVLEALDGAMSGANPIPRADLDRLISGLAQRAFLMHNVHRDAPALFTTRWVMSYLAGPMTLTQIRALKDAAGFAGAVAAAEPAPVPEPAVNAGLNDPVAHAVSRPMLPQEIRQFIVPPIARVDRLIYRPAVLASAEVRYAQARLGVNETRSVQVLVPLDDGAIAFALDDAEIVDLPFESLDSEPLPGAGFASLPGEGAQARSYARWGRDLVRWIQSSQPITLYQSNDPKLTSSVGESEHEFRIRLAERVREARDTEADRVRKKFDARARTLQDRLLRAEQAAERKRGQSQQAMINTGVAAIGGVLGALLGSGRGQIGRAGTAVRGAGRVAQTRQEAARASESVEAVRMQIDELEGELQDELQSLIDSAGGEMPLEAVEVRPALNAITMRLVALAWLPWGKDVSGHAVAVWR